MGEIIFMGIIAIISIVMFFNAETFPTSIIDKTGGPSLFPRIIIIMLIIAMIAQTVIILRDEEKRKKYFVFIEFFKGRRIAFYLLFVAYALTITSLGFFISSSLFLAIAIPFLYKLQYGAMMPVKKIVISICISTVSMFGLYYVFVNYFNVVLPSGILPI